MKEILIATTNAGKLREMMVFFRPLRNRINFKNLSDFPSTKTPVENGKNYAENALIKAKFFSEKFSIPAIGEDAGILVSALPEYFGVHTRRSIQAEDDMDWLTKFLDLMIGCEDKTAKFFSAMAFFDPTDKTSFITEGTVEGTICDFPQAPIEKGIPLSAVFKPNGSTLVFSAMKTAEKNRISHRGRAADAMRVFLEKQQ